MRRAFKGVLASLVTTVIVFAAAEVGLRGVYGARNAFVRQIPLPYALGDEYGPVPPWLDRMLILVPDPLLIWRSLPKVHRTYVDIFSPAHRAEDRVALLRRFTPALPEEFRDNPTWTIDLNADGFRGSDFSAVKPQATVRVACIGDSWTFGMNVDQDRTYPDRLAARLRELAPGSRYEIMNFGVLGYSSFQGLQLLKSRVLALHPDVVVIGFGMNDSGVPGYRDKDVIGGDQPRLAQRATESAKDLEVYKLLDYVAQVVRFHPKTIGDYLKGESGSGSTAQPLDYASMEPWTRVSPVDYEQNLREMIRLASDAGASAVLLDNELWGESPYRPVLRKVAADTHVPLVDSYQLIADARVSKEHEVERQLRLDAGEAPLVDEERRPSDSSMTTIVFRVYRGPFPVPGAMSISGNGQQLGDYAPNTVLMHDDGLEGDQRSGDGVWSYRAAFPAGSDLHYVYTNSGARGQWEGLDVPHIREFVVPKSPDGKAIYLPVETFGRVYMQADDWHTDATGYDLIAAAVATAIHKSEVSGLKAQSH